MRKNTKHIPDQDIRSFSDIRFETALEHSLIIKDEYDVEKWLFVPDTYTEYRYILGTKGKHPLVCIGINPSTAAPDRLDPTLKSVQRIANGNGFDSFLMLNICAQRATDANQTDLLLNERLHSENMKAFEYCLSLCDHPSIWAAWGTLIRKRNYFMNCLYEMAEISQSYQAQWYCAGKCSRDGHPHHPLYLRKDERLRPFDMQAYSELFK